MNIPVEIFYHNIVLETDVDGIYSSSNVIKDETICDTVLKLFPWLGWFEGKLSSVDKKKSGKVFTIKYEYNTSEHWSIEEFVDYSSEARILIGGLGFVSYEPFEDPQDTLVQKWFK